MTAASREILRRMHHVLLRARNRGIQEACRAGLHALRSSGGGCATTPDATESLCRDFECEWLTSRKLPQHFAWTASARS